MARGPRVQADPIQARHRHYLRHHAERHVVRPTVLHLWGVGGWDDATSLRRGREQKEQIGGSLSEGTGDRGRRSLVGWGGLTSDAPVRHTTSRVPLMVGAGLCDAPRPSLSRSGTLVFASRCRRANVCSLMTEIAGESGRESAQFSLYEALWCVYYRSNNRAYRSLLGPAR